MDRQAGSRVDRTEWHRIVTFQDGLIEMLERHARKGRLVYVEGKLQTRRWKKAGEETERSATEILLVPGSRVQFLERPNGASKPADDAAQQPASQADSSTGMGSEIPF